MSAAPLELSAEAMRRLVDAAMERIVEHIGSLPEQPLSYTEGGVELARSLAEPMPQTGAPFSELLDTIFERALTKSFNCPSPGYLAYVPGGGLFHAAVADLIADSINRYVGVFAGSPGLVQLEVNVLRWFCEMVGYPAGALGLLTTGGSMANLSAIVTARRERLPEDFLGGVLYCSDQVHHSIAKAALIAGFPAANVRIVPSDERYRMRLDRLREMVAEDRAAGRTPFLVVGSAGTVNTGAVDDLVGLADLARDGGLWFHVDGAYGGFFVLTERGRRRLDGLDRADSISLDPHKGLFLPYGTGCLLVRDPQTLKRAHHVHAEYLPDTPDEPDLFDFSTMSPELSRDFRGLRVWLPLKLHGVGVFRETLDEKLDLTLQACEALREIDGIEIVDEPQLSVVAFRWVRPGLSDDKLNELNAELRRRINARQNVLLTQTLLNGRYVIRICVLNFRTHADRIDRCLADIRASVADLRGLHDEEIR